METTLLDLELRALVDARRREILLLLGPSELSAGEIADHFSVTRQAVSQHLQVLHGAGMVAVRQVGTRRLYRLRQPAMEALVTFLETVLVAVAGGGQASEPAASGSSRGRHRAD